MASEPRPARIADVHELAMGMPHVTVVDGRHGNPVYQVGGKSFVFFRTPRPDAVDPVTGERYRDVIMFWVPSEADKQSMIQDEAAPFFTTAHFDGHPSVLLRASRLGELTVSELAEVITDAWLCRASPTRGAAWLSAHRIQLWRDGRSTYSAAESTAPDNCPVPPGLPAPGCACVRRNASTAAASPATAIRVIRTNAKTRAPRNRFRALAGHHGDVDSPACAVAQQMTA